MEAWKEEMYLKHHGILGMKWGDRNGPPYPLGASDHSAAEKKAGYRKSLGGGRNEELYGKKKKKTRLQRAADAAQRDADDLRKHGYTKEADAVQKVADKNREKAQNVTGLTDSQKKALKIGAAAVGTAIVAIGAYKVAKHLNNKATNALMEYYKDIGKAYSELSFEANASASDVWKKANEGMISIKDADRLSYDFLKDARNFRELSARSRNYANTGKFPVKEKVETLKNLKKGVSKIDWSVNLPPKDIVKKSSYIKNWKYY